MGTYPIHVYDVFNKEWRNFTYTTAPTEYDGFGTRVEPVAIGSFDNKAVRLVSTPQDHSTWQRERYGSGMYLAADGKRWAELTHSTLYQPHHTDRNLLSVTEERTEPMTTKSLATVTTLRPRAQQRPDPALQTPAPAREIATCTNCGKRFWGKARDGRCGVCFTYYKTHRTDRKHTHPTPDIIVGRGPVETIPSQEVSVEAITQQDTPPLPALETLTVLIPDEILAPEVLTPASDSIPNTLPAETVTVELITGEFLTLPAPKAEPLTDDEVRMVRRLVTIEGQSKAEVARQMHRSASAIADIVARKTYKHVTE